MDFAAPVFLVMVAMVCPEDLGTTPTVVNEFEARLRTQAFFSQENPAEVFDERARVVFGVNCLQKMVASELQDQMGALPANAFGFSWCQQTGQKYVFPVDQGEADKCVTKTKNTVPMRGVREIIKNNERSVGFVEELAAKGPLYLVTMDVDALDFLSPSDGGQEDTRVGILAQFTRTIEEYLENNDNRYPRMVTCGFRVRDGEAYPSLKLGVELEMLVRQAITSDFPFSTYFPEPASAFLLPAGTDALNRLQRLSFFLQATNPHEGHANDGGSENVMLRQSVRNMQDEDYGEGVLTGPAAFNYAYKGLVTRIPERWKSSAKTTGADKVDLITLLGDIINLSMIDVEPKKVVKGILAVMGVNSNNAQFIVPAARLFAAYDPISYILGNEWVEKTPALLVLAVEDINQLLSLNSKAGSDLATAAKKEIFPRLQEIFKEEQYMAQTGDTSKTWATRILDNMETVAGRTGDTVLRFLQKEILPNLEGENFNPATSNLIHELEVQPNVAERVSHTKYAHHARLVHLARLAHQAKPQKKMLKVMG